MEDCGDITAKSLGKLAHKIHGNSVQNVTKDQQDYIKNSVNKLMTGSIHDVYQTSISRIERLKDFDPDTKWIFVFYPD